MYGSNAVVVQRHLDVFAEACIERALARIAAVESDFAWPIVRLAHGETRVAESRASGLGRQTIATRDIDEFKTWIGSNDLDVRSGLRAPVTCGDVSAAPSKEILAAEALDEMHQAELHRAFIHYVYGDSATVTAWRPLIEQHRGTFAADVVTADKIVIPAKASLVISGRPVLFAVNTLELRGGKFVATVDGHYAIGNLLKPDRTSRKAL